MLEDLHFYNKRAFDLYVESLREEDKELAIDFKNAALRMEKRYINKYGRDCRMKPYTSLRAYAMIVPPPPKKENK